MKDQLVSILSAIPEKMHGLVPVLSATGELFIGDSIDIEGENVSIQDSPSANYPNGRTLKFTLSDIQEITARDNIRLTLEFSASAHAAEIFG